ncbi:flagellar basal body P-ring formation chaperone FlgA [Paraburkholderia tagetis]|uniref:Flagellar basal body P-ring formation protein FlgA n=1 Tax=Paraburkholderia tagetis TaxID=2913261 RepID=A0A9X1UIJ0_9BURK|nr:flagellar basal body P-ring formation chaperone FlgA [Paraburkholderia tagetis]MCG5074977.1 flagellar basal body P-ring formation protein FlgA [Paraburkholderia tagetis]
MPQTAPLRARRAAAASRAHRGSAMRALAPALAALGVAAALTLSGAAHAQSEAPDQQIYIAGPGDRAGSDAAQMNAMLAQASKAKPGGGAGSMGASVNGNVNANANINANAYAQNAAMLARGAQSDALNRQQELAQAQSQPGMITIPGPGERGRTAEAATPEIVTIPAPGAPGTPGVPATPAMRPALARAVQPMRVNVVTPSRAVAPVVVETAAPAGAARLPAVPVSRAPETRAPTVAARPSPAASISAVAYGQTAQIPAGQEDGERIRATALAFLQQQSAGLPGKVSITVGTVFPRGLAACAALEPFMPPGARMWGRTTVGVRCVGAKPWTLYVVGRVAVDITYYVAARQVDAGQTLSAADFAPREGDLASLPRTIITDPTQANGAVALARITAGLPLRTDMLRSASSVVIGQTVKVIAVGSNFTISSEGSVLNNAAPGQMVRVRTAGGQIISGVVKDAATVQVQI